MRFRDWAKAHLLPAKSNAYRPHLLSRRYLLGLLLLALAAEGLLVGSLAIRESGAPIGAAVIQKDIVALTNAERAGAGDGILAENAQLDAAAAAKAADMAKQDYFSHVGPDGKQPWDWIAAAGYDYQYAGENLAVRFVDSRDVVDAWMASPTHRANIIKPVYTEVGVGVAQGLYKGDPATYVVQYFGTPSSTMLAARAEGGTVLGVATGVSPSFVDSLTRQLVRLLAQPRGTATWVLGGISGLLMLVLIFAFFHHLQIQARDLLVPGALVAGVALALCALNLRYLAPGGQSASAAQSDWSVVVGAGVHIER